MNNTKKILIGIMVLLILKAIYPTNENFANMGYIFEINDNYKLRRVNKDILIIDNFYKHPERVLRYAVTNRHNFFTHKSIYKNQCLNPRLYYNKSTNFTDFFEEVLEKRVSKKVWNWYVKNGSNGWIQYNTSNIKPLIHSDNSFVARKIDPETNWGVVIYLKKNPEKHSGTGFYIHNASNLKEIPKKSYVDNLDFKTRKRLKGYLDNDFNEHSDSDKFTQYYECKNVYNRMVLFKASLFHCALNSYGTNLKNSRFFQTFFLKMV